jgi:hypothetical protein
LVARRSRPARSSWALERRLWANRICPVADVGLQAVDGQDGAALFEQERVQSGGVERRQGAEFVVAVQEVADGALGQGEVAAEQGPVDLGDALVLGVAHDRSVSAREPARRTSAPPPRAGGTCGSADRGPMTAPDAQAESEDVVECGDGALVVVIQEEGSPQAGQAAVCGNRVQ